MSEELILSPADAAWHERRRTVVGASEVALLFGLQSFGNRTIGDLWFEKKYGTVDSKPNESAVLGILFEPIILQMAEKRLGTQIVDRQKWIVDGPNAATLDGRVINQGPIVEAKTSGIVGPSKMSEWGEDGSDDVPDNYLVQVQSQLMVTGAELAYLAALIGGRGFAMFTIEPAHSIQAAIRRKSEEFIASLQLYEPPSMPPQLETLKRLRRQPNKTVEIPDDLWLKFEEAKATAKEGDDAAKLAQRELLTALADAEQGECRLGTVTYFEQKRKAYSVEESSYRVLRMKK